MLKDKRKRISQVMIFLGGNCLTLKKEFKYVLIGTTHSQRYCALFFFDIDDYIDKSKKFTDP